MKRSAFTLIELVISIALFGLITVFMFGTIDELRKQQNFYQKKERSIGRQNTVLSLLRTDLYRPVSLTLTPTQSKDFDLLFITGSNHSLYGIDRPYVVWVVFKADHALVRLESAVPITLPLRPEALYLTHSDTIQTQTELFRLYDSPRSRFVYVQFEHQSPLFAEITK